MHPTRRQMLQRSVGVAGLLAAAGLLPPAAQAAWPMAAFDAGNLADVIKALGGSAPVESAEVTITGPQIAENGAVVSVSLASTLPGVSSMLLLVEKNPTVLSAVFYVSDAIEPAFSTRVKMNESSPVIAVAMTADGRVRFARTSVEVTVGGCGG